MLIKGEVTQEDIDKGISNDAMCCPIGRSLMSLGFFEIVSVTISQIIVIRKKTITKIVAEPTLQMQEFIAKYDRHGKDHVKPFIYELEFS